MQKNASKMIKGRLRTPRERQRQAHRDLARVARGGMPAPNFHTHIGHVVLDANGEPTYERVPSIHGNGRYRIRYEYVPRFSDPAETARVMVMAAARKAKLDARRAAKADRVAATEARRTLARSFARNLRAVRAMTEATRRTRAVTAGRRGWTLPRRLRERVTAE